MARTLIRVLVLHGPNLNLLGTRETHLYGTSDLPTIEAELQNLGFDLGALIDSRQSNHEGQLVDWIHEARTSFDAILINAGAYTHTSIAVRDAIAAVAKPCVEVHLSNVYRREEFRHTSLLAPVCLGTVVGFGPNSYALGLRGLIEYLRAPDRGSDSDRADS
jgi:3-dehydroquinate dehydratase II